MIDEKIPRERWQDFCESFSRQHRGWLVSILRASPGTPSDPGARVMSEDRPLRDITPTIQTEGDDLIVTVGDGTSETSVRVRQVEKLFAETSNGAHAGLRIDSHGDAGSTFIRFRTAAVPEELDGFAGSEQ